MIERGYDRIVNIASVAVKEGNENSTADSSAKAAAIRLTKSAGEELAKTGVIVSALTPGLIETRHVEQVTPSHHEYLLSKIAMGRGWEAAGGGGDGALPNDPALQLLDGIGLRHQRWPRHILIRRSTERRVQTCELSK